MFFPGSGALLHTSLQYQVQTDGEYSGNTAFAFLAAVLLLMQPMIISTLSASVFVLGDCYNGHFEIWVKLLISVLGILSLGG